MLRLEPVGPENWRPGLSVAESQKGFAADAMALLARAYAYREQRSRAFIIQDGDTPVGMALYHDCAALNAFDLSQLFIDRSFQRRGFGEASARQILAQMADDGRFHRVVLCYIDGNDAARALWEKLGFVPTGERDGNEIVLVRTLTPAGSPSPEKRRAALTVAAAVVVRDGRILLCQRRPEVHNGLKWEFPGGKLEPGETPEAALARELKEELDIEVAVGPVCDAVLHRYPDRDVLLLFYPCRILSGEPRTVDCNAAVWVPPEDLPGYDLAAADRAFVDRGRWRGLCFSDGCDTLAAIDNESGDAT